MIETQEAAKEGGRVRQPSQRAWCWESSRGVDQCPILINHSVASGLGATGFHELLPESTNRSPASLLWVSLEATFTSLRTWLPSSKRAL